MAKIRHFVDFYPMNCLAYPLEADARDILAQFGEVKIMFWVWVWGGGEKGVKNAHFWTFSG